MAYNEEDFLQLSGLQHFRFCRRRWALIHIEHQWAENYRTIDGEIRRRERVSFTPELRAGVRELLAEMHELYRRGYTPKVKPSKSCNACSLKELCLPKLMKSRAVSAYLRAAMEESP